MPNSLLEDITLEGKNALITGGTKGIGRAIDDHLARAGAKVVVTARTSPEGGRQHDFFAADMATPEGTAAVVKQINEKFGGVDILVDNVGGMTAPGGRFGALTDEHWEKELRVQPAVNHAS